MRTLPITPLALALGFALATALPTAAGAAVPGPAPEAGSTNTDASAQIAELRAQVAELTRRLDELAKKTTATQTSADNTDQRTTQLSDGFAAKPNQLFYLVRVDNARFSRTVVPGDQVLLEVEQKRMLRRMGQYHCRASVDGKEVARAELLCAAPEQNA